MPCAWGLCSVNNCGHSSHRQCETKGGQEKHAETSKSNSDRRKVRRSVHGISLTRFELLPFRSLGELHECGLFCRRRRITPGDALPSPSASMLVSPGFQKCWTWEESLNPSHLIRRKSCAERFRMTRNTCKQRLSDIGPYFAWPRLRPQPTTANISHLESCFPGTDGRFLDNFNQRPLLFFIRMMSKFLTMGAHS